MGVLKLMPTHCFIPTLIQPMTNLPIPHPSVMEFSNLRIKKVLVFRGRWNKKVQTSNGHLHTDVRFNRNSTSFGAYSTVADFRCWMQSGSRWRLSKGRLVTHSGCLAPL